MYVMPVFSSSELPNILGLATKAGCATLVL